MPSDAVPAPRPGPYTPADLAATPDDGQRYELVDGALLVSWSRTPLHQRAAGRLCSLLNAAGAAELEAACTIEVQCGPATVLVPDVVVLRSSVVDEPDRVVVADDVALVAEIVWPAAARIDRILKSRGSTPTPGSRRGRRPAEHADRSGWRTGRRPVRATSPPLTRPSAAARRTSRMRQPPACWQAGLTVT